LSASGERAVTFPPAEPGILDQIRDRCAEVTRRAQLVHIDAAALGRFAAGLTTDAPVDSYPDSYFRGDRATTCRFVLALESINFGSGWHPTLAKRAGLSGHLTIATGLTDLAGAGDLWTADQLTTVTATDCARVFGQPDRGEPFELMGLFAAALNDLGRLLLNEFDGDPVALIDAADRSAEGLLIILDRMPYFRDVGRYPADGIDLVVPLYKRAQLCSATLSLAFDGDGPGAFDDLAQLTMFADNLVPHVLWCEGVLRFDPGLEGRIAAGELLAAGGLEEIELRAVAVSAVEQLAAASGLAAMTIDDTLWDRGQRSAYKARPRPRIRTTAF
jgi:hypothetical protein